MRPPSVRTDVYERARSGEDFAKLAVAYSNSQTALDGGALGWRKGGELPTFLTDVIAKLKPGEVSEPLRTPTGYHIIRLNEVRGAAQNAVEDQIHVRHILMKTNELADDATVRTKLLALRERILKGEDFAGVAQTSSQDPGSAAEGGDLGWGGPGTFAPEFEQVVGTLKDNEISEPFHTPVRLAHRADARPPPHRQHRRAQAPPGHGSDPRQQGRRGDRAVAAAHAG